jgi:hypothetical protein
VQVILYRAPFTNVEAFVRGELKDAVDRGTPPLPSLLCTPVSVLVGRKAAREGQLLLRAPVVILGGPKALHDMERGWWCTACTDCLGV